MGCHFLLQGIFPTQGSNLGFLHCRQTFYPLSHQGSYIYTYIYAFLDFLPILVTTRASSHHWVVPWENSEYSLEGLMLKLKLQYFGHLMWTANSLEKILMLETIEGKRRRGGRGWGGWIASLTQWTWIWAHSRWLWRTEKPDVLQFMGSQRVGHDLAAEQQQKCSDPVLGIGNAVVIKISQPLWNLYSSRRERW